MSKRNNDSIIRNLVFGIQDSFGSTVGFLSGVAVSGISRETLLFTGILLIFVEAFSMALGSLISEHVVLEARQQKKLPLFKSFAGPITMFIAYVTSGFVPLTPYILFWGPYSLLISIVVSLVTLSIASYFSARMYKISPMHHIKETLLISVIAIGVGVLVGKLFPNA